MTTPFRPASAQTRANASSVRSDLGPLSGLVQPTAFDVVLAAELSQLRDQNRERRLRRIANRRGAIVETELGAAVDFSSNDYLGLASDQRLADASERAMREHGVGAGAARLISGNTPEHEALEAELATLFDAEAALTFSSGYAANVGIIPALVGRGDVIYSDALNHASVIDGCRLSRADVHIFPHRDLGALATLLDRHRAEARRALVVTDGLFSMDGDAAPLPDIVELSRRFDAWSYVDDAHAIGVIGDGGRGSASAAGCHGQIDVTVGTLGKAFGGSGAFVYGSSALIQYLLNRARSFIFSTAVPPAQAAAAREAIRIARAEPERRARVMANARHVREALHSTLGSMLHTAARFDRGAPPAWIPDGTSHIIPLVVGRETRALSLGATLASRGYLVGAIRPPTVPEGGSRLRITVSAAHSADQIAGLTEALAVALRE